MKQVITYNHHGYDTSVFKANKGKHTENCLCFSCVHFSPGKDDNCAIAQSLYEFDITHKVTTPVWECATYTKSGK